MPEGLSASEVGKEARRHREEHEESSTEHRHRAVFIAEALLLAIVTIVTAWAGYAAAKWSTESRVELAEASTTRAQASRAELEAMELRNFDSSTFQAWFAAFVQGNATAEEIATRR